MAENKSGLHAIITLPRVFNFIQWLAGAKMYRNKMLQDYIKPFDGCRILDIGCGTGEYIDHLDDFCKEYEYYGFDGEAVYIDHAKKVFKDRKNVHFYLQILTEDSIKDYEGFDMVIATGVLHHLDDQIVTSLLKVAKLALKPGGKFVSYDPGKFEKMSVLENVFWKYDRGRSIRTVEQTEALIKPIFPNYKAHTPYLTYYKSRNIVFECFNT